MEELNVNVTELTKDYVILNDEKIYFDEPFEDVPNKEEFRKWLENIKDFLLIRRNKDVTKDR